MPNYLYNGTELPKLPEWDKSVYPYALIGCYNPEGTGVVSAYLWLSTAPLYRKTSYLSSYLATKETSTTICYCYDTTDTTGEYSTDWGRRASKDAIDVTAGENVAGIGGNTPIWSNYDFLNYSDDTLYLAATDPVPVLEWHDKTPYRRMNNQWVKQDTYRRENGKWVKQDEYRRE